MLDCNNCLEKCKAVCCGVVPFSKKFIARHKPVRAVIRELRVENDEIVLETDKMRCPYLNEDYSCSVYHDRPEVCRLYGNETQINLTCQYQDKNGRIRSRQEKRAVERKITKFIKAYVKASNKI